MFRVTCLCRGNGKGYAQIAVPADVVDPLQAVAETSNGKKIACPVYEMAFPGEDPQAAAMHGACQTLQDRKIVVVFPLLDSTTLSISLFSTRDNCQALWVFPINATLSKIRSRLTYQLHTEEAHQIRDIDQVQLSGQPYVFITGIYPLNQEHKVCRFRFVGPFEHGVEYRAEVMGAGAETIGQNPMVLDDSVVPDADDPNRMLREITYSVILNNADMTVCISISPMQKSRWNGCFTCQLPDQVESFLEAGRSFEQHASVEPHYMAWFNHHRSNAADVAYQKYVVDSWSEKPLISIITPVFRPDPAYLEAMIRSVLEQSYDYFELLLVNASGDCPAIDQVLDRIHDQRIKLFRIENKGIVGNTNFGIEHATGDYVAFIDHDDVIEPDTLYRYVSVIRSNADVDVLYCDEDHLKDGHYFWPTFKPAFNPDLLYAHNYITHMLMVSRWVLNQVELSPEDVNGAQDYDLTLKCCEIARSIRNVPYMLYHWREHEGSTSQDLGSKPYAVEAGRKALQRHFDREGLKVDVQNRNEPCAYRVVYDYHPLVSIIIPTKDHIDLLSNCIQSVLEKTEYSKYEIICVENNSEEESTFAYYRAICEQSDKVRVVTWPGTGFNYSAICNYGASFAQGDILLFLNNDTEIVSPQWLTLMSGHFMRSDVGIVGAKLFNRDGLVQHGGLFVVPGGCDYLNLYMSRYASGYMNSLRFPFDCAAVTGACQMIRRTYFEQVGGFDEQLAVSFSDVDICLKISQLGARVVMEPGAELYHRESSSRGRDDNDKNKLKRMEKEKYYFFNRWSDIERGIYMNSNLNQYDGHFKL